MSDVAQDFFGSRGLDEIPLGIDFGTTNTVAAYCREESRLPDLVRYGPDAVSLRSLLNIGNIKNGGGTVLVGRAAEQRAEADPDPRTLVSNVKSDLGCTKDRREDFRRRRTPWFPAGDPMDPEDAVAFIFQYVRNRAMRQLRDAGHSANIRRAAIGIPARATQEYRLCLKRAAEIAGLDVVLLVPEPVAACWAYFVTRLSDAPQRILVVDIGAGTTDLSLIDLGTDLFRILLTAGDTQCGGTAVDHQILRYVAKKFPDVEASLRNFTNWQTVRLAKEKSNLITDSTLMMNHVQHISLVDRSRHAVQVSLSGAEIHESAQRVTIRLQPLFEKLFLNGLLALPQVQRERKVGGVLLVGGACRTRAFLEELTHIIGGSELSKFFALETPFSMATAGHFATDSYLAVGRGLALLAKSSEPESTLISQMYFTSHLVDPIGLGVVNDSSGVLLPEGVLRNSVHLEAFTPVGQTSGAWYTYGLSERAWGTKATKVRLCVLAGEGSWFESDQVADVEGFLRTARCLGECVFALAYPRESKYVRIGVMYEMDVNGVITLQMRDLGGDDLDAGKSYLPQPVEAAKVFRLELGQLDSVTARGKRERLKKILVRGELFDEVADEEIEKA